MPTVSYVNLEKQIQFTIESEENETLSFLDIKITRENGKFITSVYRKPTFSGVYTHFHSFIPDKYKFGMIYTIIYRCHRICSGEACFQSELKKVKEIFKKNG